MEVEEGQVYSVGSACNARIAWRRDHMISVEWVTADGLVGSERDSYTLTEVQSYINAGSWRLIEEDVPDTIPVPTGVRAVEVGR